MKQWMQFSVKCCLPFITFALLCGCITTEAEKRETLDRILRDEVGNEEEDSGGSTAQSEAQPAGEEQPTPAPAPQPTPAQQPTEEKSNSQAGESSEKNRADSNEKSEVPLATVANSEAKPKELQKPSGIDLPPLASEPPGIGNRPAPNVVQPQTLKLPLPRGVVHADIFQFLNAHSEIVASYQPLADEWKIFMNVFGSGQQASEDEVGSLRLRVRENLARTHWLFVWGIYQSSLALLTPQRNLQLSMDKMQDFVERMNVLVFLMGEMKAGGMRAEYKNYLRTYYKFANNKYFKRPMRNREGKPESPIAPTQPPAEKTDEGTALNPESKPSEKNDGGSELNPESKPAETDEE